MRGLQVQLERDELYQKFTKAIQEVQQKSGFKNLLLERKLDALTDTLEKKEAQLNEVLAASNLDHTALNVVTRKLEVKLCTKIYLLYSFSRIVILANSLSDRSQWECLHFLCLTYDEFICVFLLKGCVRL